MIDDGSFVFGSAFNLSISFCNSCARVGSLVMACECMEFADSRLTNSVLIAIPRLRRRLPPFRHQSQHRIWNRQNRRNPFLDPKNLPQ
jgi:hypothetical protein